MNIEGASGKYITILQGKEAKSDKCMIWKSPHNSLASSQWNMQIAYRGRVNCLVSNAKAWQNHSDPRCNSKQFDLNLKLVALHILRISSSNLHDHYVVC